ncbi:Clp protease N-terminal domain-containing protein [Microterricola viridarii]|uniref:Clp amino terminal domain-containing protein, pathogenicity island component n=1 Tax=Microterricola viridarii TaxID=412690 RepID=A0A1H1RD61_9MICO|nr:Clp protease N-terminal domain-containing protein [Microterricola viridarii]SDS33486.1 Clp amino terminal domain-containing protein, pathogenicity island component [Microterricola viridarii]
MFERFSRSARAAVEDAVSEAARRGDRRIGTDHLLLALLADDDVARLVGVDAATAQGAVDRLDRSALAAVGITLGEFRHTAPAVLARPSASMSSGAKAVLTQALAHAVSEKARAITSRHLLLAVLDRNEPDPAASLLAALPVDRPALRQRLADAG